MHLVVGLGNPGASYAKTRHNVGFLVVDRLAERGGAAVERKLFGALVGEATLAGRKALLVKPQQFMNLSGQPVASVLGFYKVPKENVVVVHDDMDLPFAKLRLRQGGGHGGHNGMRDLQQHLGPDTIRVRCGVGRPPAGWDAADYVLGRWSAEEDRALPGFLDQAADAVEAILQDGLARAMNTFNPTEPKPARGKSSAEGPSLPSPTSKRNLT